MKMVPLGELLVKRAGTVDPSKHPDEKFDLYSIPAYDNGAPDLVSGSEIGSAKQVVQPGDVLLSRIVPHIRRAWVVGKVAGRRIIASGEWMVFRSDSVHPPWLRHMLLGDQFHQQLMATVAGVGGSLMRARPAYVATIEIPLPPLPEQRRIAAILDHADALRAKRSQVLNHLDRLAESVFTAMFGGEAALKPISQLCELMVDCVNRTAPTVDEPTRYKMLRTTNIRNGRVDTSNVRFVTADVFERWNRRATPRRGDVILTREAPVGEPGILESDDSVFLGQRLFLYRANPAHLTSEFLLACFRSPILKAQFDRLGSGSTVKHLPLPACQNFLVPAPPLKDQNEYSIRVRQIKITTTRVLEASVHEEQLFASLQSRAFRGEL